MVTADVLCAALEAIRPADLIGELARLRRARARAAAAGEFALACEYALRASNLEVLRAATLGEVA